MRRLWVVEGRVVDGLGWRALAGYPLQVDAEHHATYNNQSAGGSSVRAVYRVSAYAPSWWRRWTGRA